MNSHLEVISQWTINNRMQLNLSKSSVMWFRAPSQRVIPSPPGIFVSGIHLAVVCKQKYLGLIFDDTLSWSCLQGVPINVIVSNKQRLVFKTSLLKFLIESLVFSRLVYCLPVWGPPLTVTSINRLKCLQHRAVQLCLGLRRCDHITHQFHSLQWLPLCSEIQYR